MADTAPVLSIIIPVYNVEDYVADTLRSCLEQDIPSETYEILCIDDGSTDGSAAVVAAWATENANIRLFRRDNHGVSATRNFGLEQARGTYIWFVDSDDLILPNCLGALLGIMERENPDYFQFSLCHFTQTPPAVERQVDYAVCDDLSQIYAFLYGKSGGGVCRLWFRRDVLIEHSLHFAEHIRYSEDVLFAYEAMLVTRKAVKIALPCYFYRQRPGSAMHTQNGKAFAESMLKLADAYQAIAETCPPEWREITLRKRCQATRALLFSVMQTGNVAYAKEMLAILTDKGYYPYPLNKDALRGNETRKQAIINRVSYLFPKRRYFLTCVRLYGLLKGTNI